MRGRKNKVKSYFEITEDPPQVLPPLRNTNRSFKNYKLPTNNSFFFIDFTEDCQLRLLKKRHIEHFGEPLDLEKFGKNVIINVEDASPPEGQLIKYEEQRLALRDKRAAIEGKLKHRLEEGFKFRSKSHFAIRQELIDEYTSPIKLPRKQSTPITLPGLGEKSPKEVGMALKRLGLKRQWQV